VASERVVERRRVFQQYKEDVKDRGKPFYPYAMFHDTVMSLVVVCVIIGLAIVWRYTSLLGKLYDLPADSGTINFVPRPDWYFYFLFYLLRIFKWPNTVILGTIGIPTICLILLLLLPFYDVRPERNPLKRPVAMVAGVLVIISMGVAAGLREQPESDRRREPVRRRRLRELPPVPRDRRRLRGCAQPLGGGREGQGRRLPDPPSGVPLVRQSRLADALVPGSRTGASR